MPEGVVQLARNSMPAMRDNSAGMGREAPVCESWVVMRREEFVLSPGCDHAPTVLFAKSILANPCPDNLSSFPQCEPSATACQAIPRTHRSTLLCNNALHLSLR